MDNIIRNICITLVFTLLAVVSISKITPQATNPDNHKHSIEQIDEKIETTLALAGVSAGSATVMSLFPEDWCTPIADQLAELSKFFLLVLSALYVEKYLISVSGFITFAILIPVALALICSGIVFGKSNFKSMGLKVATVGLIIYMIVPISVTTSDLIYTTEQQKIDDAIDTYNNLDFQDDSSDNLLLKLKNTVLGTLDKATGFVKSLIDALAVTIVTACLIPLLVLLFLVWGVKALFSQTSLSIDDKSMDKFLKRGSEMIKSFQKERGIEASKDEFE